VNASTSRSRGLSADRLPSSARPPTAAQPSVLHEAIELGITHIDTGDFYGLFVANQIIGEVLYPYPDDPPIVTKVGSCRAPKGGRTTHARSPRPAAGPIEYSHPHNK
jgi:aryl-alcohol dehydrogenase-like predicted oxidoreductase